MIEHLFRVCFAQSSLEIGAGKAKEDVDTGPCEKPPGAFVLIISILVKPLDLKRPRASNSTSIRKSIG